MTTTLRLIIIALALTPLSDRTAMAEPIGLMEKYALASDRSAMLAELIPGSEDYFFFHTLHYQTIGQTDRSETMLNDWIAANKGRQTPAIANMMDRQRLLTYNDSPQRTIDYLVKRLKVRFDHAPPTTSGERRFPSQINADKLTVNRLVTEALQRNDAIKPIGLRYIAERFREDETAGLNITLHDFLRRIDAPLIDGLGELVAKELASRKDNAKRFGDLSAHSLLTLDELDEVAGQVPSIADDNAFVTARLNRLRCSGDQNINQQPKVRLEYLKRIEAYVRTLPPSFNSLKAAATYRLLEANLAESVYDRALFLRYLQLPRNSPIVHRQLNQNSHRVNLSDDFTTMALLRPVGDEQELVRRYLEHFLREANDPSDFAKYLQPAFLTRVFAQTKLMSGVGDPKTWYAMLSASERKAVRDWVVLRLTPQNKTYFADDDPSELIVDLKNIDELVVRVYQINTAAYFQSQRTPINTDIDLDGLVASSETKYTYDHPAVQRHRQRITLDEVAGRGVWIVDLVGKGVRARALIRRGEIHHVDETVADGMQFTIVDENQKPIAGATMVVGAKEFVADEMGRIGLPPVADHVDRTAVISDGKISKPIKFHHLQETYRLDAGMHVDRTQLQSGGTGKLLLRPRLTMAGHPVAPELLKDVSVTIKATDLDDLTTTIQIENLELSQNQELVIPFRVPPRLANLQATLSGNVTAISNGRQQLVTTSRDWDIASIRRTSHIHDTFLTRDGDQYVIDVRGRTGETIAGATVSISLTTNVRNAAVEQTLQSDDRGQILLGSLDNVTHLRYGVAGGIEHERDLTLDRTEWPDHVHTTIGQSVRLPMAEHVESVGDRFRLLEIRGDSIFRDASDQLSIVDGMLITKQLAAGDYQLIDRQSGTKQAEQPTQITVVDGPRIGNVVAGATRHRSLSPNQPLGIASIQRVGQDLRIKLSGETRFSRVHVYASRYLDSTDPLLQLGLPQPQLSGRSISRPRCGYVSDLRLGDEYQYVLRRQYAAKYPGVMLPQPSVILNPWETQSTTNTLQSAQLGDAPQAAAMAEPDDAYDRAAAKANARANAESSDYDFMADAGVITANLAVDENGMVTIPADVIGGLPIIQIIVSDPVTLLQRTVAAPSGDVETIDLRLKESLASDQAFSFQRAVTIVSKDQPLDLQSLGSAQVQVYGSVGSLFKLYKTLQTDARLNDFDELVFWHKADNDVKLSAYSRLASHELHLFLWAHDREFFDSVVKDYLANKKEKQFVDHWLLGDDLTPYTKLWQYNQLNAAERALLAMRMPTMRQSIRRELTEMVANQDENYQAIREQIEQALVADGLASSELFDLDDDAVALGIEVDSKINPLSIESKAMWGARPERRLSERESLGRSMKRSKKKSDKVGAILGGRAAGGGFAGKAYGFYQELDATKQWAEGHWDRVRVVGGPKVASLINVNPFWQHIAQSEAESIQPSTHLLRPVDSRHSVLVALAMCGLPLEAGKIGLPTEKDQPYAPEHAVAVVTKRLKNLQSPDQESNLLVGQQFSLLSERKRKRKTSSEPIEFLTDTAYQGQTVVSNPTNQRQIVDVFWQIPAGSLPLGGSQVTDSRTVTLEPFAVEAIEYEFYFPSVGQFEHYPATVASDGKLLARGNKKTFPVVATPTEDDAVTWDKIARTGSPEQIQTFLNDANLRDLDWMLIAHRMDDQAVYQTVIRVLREANLGEADLWAYSLKHRDEAAMKTFLSLRDDLTQQVGPVLNSVLLDVEPIERHSHELLEYAPLVRARIHRLGSENEILNATFLRQYQSFVRMVGFQKQTPVNERLVLTYYLLLQNRIEEALQVFSRIEREQVSTKIQYDYMAAYLGLHRESYQEAGRLAAQYATHPIPRWKNRFGEIANQLAQRDNLLQGTQLVNDPQADHKDQSIPPLAGDLAVLDREQRQAAATQQSPEVVVTVDGSTLRIDHRRANKVTLRLYGVDLELLFSKAPFVREDLQKMAIVKPLRSESIDFDDANGVGTFQLDENLRRQTLLVEVVAGADRSTALYYGGQMTTYVSQSTGQLQATDAGNHRPITKAYVKVYAKYPDGSVKFYKDGYTDLRGRFDYTSLSAMSARGATRFAILVMSDEKGATLHDVAAPKQ